MLMSMMLAAAAATSATERISLDHAGRTVAAEYRAELAVDRRQVGAMGGTRMGTRRCNWTASVVVHRDTATADGASIPALSRSLSREKAFSGSRAGECDTARTAIDAEIAGREDRVRSALAEAIARDRPTLMAELDSIGPVMASRAR